MSKKNVKFAGIKKIICEREAESRAVYRKNIRESSGRARYDAWNAKRVYGDETRYYILAYCMLRGRPYLACEKKRGERNAPSPLSIASSAKQFGYLLKTEDIEAWLAGQPLKDCICEPGDPCDYHAATRTDVPRDALFEPKTAEPPKTGFVMGLKRLIGAAS